MPVQSETKEIFDVVMAEICSKSVADIKPQNQEAQRTLSSLNTKTIYTQAYHIQTVEYQRKEKLL